MWRVALDEAAAAGLVSGDLGLLRLAMLGALNWTLQWYRHDGPLDVRGLADDLLVVFVPSAARSARRSVGRAASARRAPLTRGTSPGRT
jgi:hypothetical protein